MQPDTKAKDAVKEPTVAWWIALAHQPDRLIEMAEGQLAVIAKANEHGYKVAGKISAGENNRHSVKLAAVERLMKPAVEGEKGMARTVAEAAATTDDKYRDYLNHLADLQMELERYRHEAEVARLRFRLIEQALRRAIDHEGTVVIAEAPAPIGGPTS